VESPHITHTFPFANQYISNIGAYISCVDSPKTPALFFSDEQRTDGRTVEWFGWSLQLDKKERERKTVYLREKGRARKVKKSRRDSDQEKKEIQEKLSDYNYNYIQLPYFCYGEQVLP